MSEDGVHPWETILRLCEAAAPEPWYPHLLAKQEGVDPQELDSCLDDLCLSGLIERVEGDSERGPAISLTREGQRVLLDPEAMQRLRAGKPLSSQDRAGFVRQALQGRSRAYFTYLLGALSLLLFVAGYYAADKVGAGSEFLRGTPLTVPFAEVLEKSGALRPEHVIEGQWWRLLTAGFVHVGSLNLFMHLFALFFAGRFIEQTWGHVHYLVIYLISVVGGSCLGVAHSPDVVLLAGSPGVICGLLAAEVVWFLFNRRYLPRALLRQARRVFLINLVLLFFLTSFRNVSAWGDIGGAAAGAVTGMLLQLQRFGPSMWRWFALSGFVPLVWYGQFALEHARVTIPAWQEVEDKHFEDRIFPELNRAAKKARAVYQQQAVPLLERHPTRRDPAKVDAVLPVLGEQQHELNVVAERLDHEGPYVSETAETARQIGLAYVLAMKDWLAGGEQILRLGDKRTDKDRQALRQQEEKVNDLERKWKDLFE
jgi:rhomboid protease GluP